MIQPQEAQKAQEEKGGWNCLHFVSLVLLVLLVAKFSESMLQRHISRKGAEGGRFSHKRHKRHRKKKGRNGIACILCLLCILWLNSLRLCASAGTAFLCALRAAA